MTYQEFKRELYRNLQQQEMSHGKKILLLEREKIPTQEDITTLVRLINLGYYGKEEAVMREDIICVAWSKQGTVNMMHWRVRPVYERFKREGWQGVLPEMVAKIQGTGHYGNRLSLNEGATAKEGATESNQLIVRPLQYSYYREVFTDGICWRFGDIVLALYLMVRDNADELVTVKINRHMAEQWNVTEETLLTNALLNTYAKMPPRLYYGTDTGLRHTEEYGTFMPGERGVGIIIHPDNEQEGLHGYVLTTTKWQYGAVALFYPGVKERLAELLDGDYYVGFTSTNEVVVHPARHKVLRELKAAMQRTNILFDKKERLTDRVYRYSCNRKELIEV